MHNLALTYRCRPSELLGITNTHAAFCYDRATAIFGNTLKQELDEVEGKKKQEIKKKRDQILRRWFPEARSKEQQFRDPGSR
jgi:hypothetical protein